MPRNLALLFIFIVYGFTLSAQTSGIRGRLQDAQEKTPLSGATIQVSAIEDSTFRINVVSGQNGSFIVRDLRPGDYRMRISSVGYNGMDSLISFTGGLINLGILGLFTEASLLTEVIVQGSPPPVRQRADTLEYNAGSFKVNPDASAEDMVRKMPGITVENGAVKAGGEDVRKVTVDGREFFGDDAAATLKNLPAEIIDKIQVFDRLSDQAQFTGFDDGNTTKSINIVTKANMRNGQFGRLYAGYGTDDRYSLGGNVSFFKDNRRISLVGLFNNVNQQNFASEDLLGLTSNQNRRGGRGGGRGGGGFGGGFGGGNSENFLVGQQGGISKTNAFGINFSDSWGKKTEISGSYFFNQSNNSSNEQVGREFFLDNNSSQFYKESSLSSSTNYNHRINLRMEFKLDSFNTILVTPNISFQNNRALSSLTGINSFNEHDISSESSSKNSRNNSGYNISNGILYRHAFNKRGRTASINLRTSINNRDGETYMEALNRYFATGDLTDSLMQYTDQLTKGSQVSANIAYTEPIGAKGQLQINYSPSYSKNNADQQVFQYERIGGKYSLFDSSLSNKYDNIYATQNGGVSYRVGNRDNMFSVGLSYQYANLSGEQAFPVAVEVNRSFVNALPNLMFRRKLSPKSSLNIFYRTSTNAPSVTQLQQVINNSNPLFLRTGNPELDQQYTHRVVGRYAFTNSSKGQSFLANVFLEKRNDYIGNGTFIASSDSVLSSTVTLYKGSQLIKPVNMDGYLNIRSFLTYSMPLKFIKTNMNLNAGYSFGKTPGMINNVFNYSNSQTYSFGAVLASNVSEYVDFSLSYTANTSNVKNSIQPELNNHYFNQVARFELNLLTKNGWLLQNDLNNQTYRGLTDGFNQNFWLWNISAGKKFLKAQKGELKLSVFDLLKQNRSISRTATETYIEDLQTQVLQQYFMLTFSYKLKNFGGK